MANIRVNSCLMVWYFIVCGFNMAKVLEKLNKTHRRTPKHVDYDGLPNDYYFYMCCKKVRILQSVGETTKALSNSSKAKLSYTSTNFNMSHGHKMGLDNLNVQDRYWQPIHKSLAHAHDYKDMDGIVTKNIVVLTSKYNFEYDMVTTCEEFVGRCWAEYCFGANVNYDEYMKIRTKLIELLRKTFYNHSISGVWLLGGIMCKLRYLKHQKEFMELDNEITTLLLKTDNGFIHRFRKNILEAKGVDVEDYDTIANIIIDNTFLSFLVYDFINLLLQQRLLSCNMSSPIQDHLEEAFLFPFRMRTVDGVVTIFNIVSTGLYFSDGSRRCVGEQLTKNIDTVVTEELSKYIMTCSNKDRVYRGKRPENNPTIESKHTLTLTLPKDYLKEVIPAYEHKGKSVAKFYRLEGITEIPYLYTYLRASMVKYIKKYNPDIVITAEARGFVYAGSIIDATNKPVILARKAGKLAGATYTCEYKKAYDNGDVLQISTDSKLESKTVVIVDDGIATGGTLGALHELVESCGGKVIACVVGVRHTYKKNIYTGSPVEAVFEL